MHITCVHIYTVFKQLLGLEWNVRKGLLSVRVALGQYNQMVSMVLHVSRKMVHV